MSVLLVTGGARSGKSAYAEQRTLAIEPRPFYIATAYVADEEMEERVATHQARRGPEWRNRHAPMHLCDILQETDGQGARLVDCLTLWVTNLLLSEHDARADIEALATCLAVQKSPVILVTSEVGLGIVPDNALARQFRDLAGFCNQRMAAMADEVQFVISGLPMQVKSPLGA